MLVVYALGRIFNTHKFECFFLISDESRNFSLYLEVIKICHFRSVQINGFKTDAQHNAMYSR